VTLEEVEAGYRRIDRSWQSVSAADRRIHVVQLRQFEQQMTILDDEVDQVEIRDMTQALRLLRGRIEISLST